LTHYFSGDKIEKMNFSWFVARWGEDRGTKGFDGETRGKEKTW